MDKLNNLIDTLVIDSDYRTSDSKSTTNFFVDVPVDRFCKLYRIQTVVIPMNMYNIDSTNNTFTIGGVGKTITVGLYNINTLLLELNTMLNPTYTVTILNNSFIKISSAGIFTLNTGTFGYSIGFPNNTSYTGATSYTGQTVPDISQSNYFTLHSNILVDRQIVKFSQKNIPTDCLMVIPNNSDGPQSVFNYVVPHELSNLISINNTSTAPRLQFTLRNDYGWEVDMPYFGIQIIAERYKL